MTNIYVSIYITGHNEPEKLRNYVSPLKGLCPCLFEILASANVEDLEIRKEIIDDNVIMVQLHDTTARYIYIYIYIYI
jgi:hypothetical protein